MTEEELADLLRDQVKDLNETVVLTEAVRPFVQQDLSANDDLTDSYVSNIYSLIQKSEAMSLLIDEFLESEHKDRELVRKANDLVSRAKSEIARFRDQRYFADLGIADETDKTQ